LCEGLNDLYRAGARWITFGGGEPLLRSDISDTDHQARRISASPCLSAQTGGLFPDKLDALREVDNVNLSLDGPEEIHDAVRGTGAFADTINASGTLRDAGIPFSYQCVLAKHNLHCLKETLEIAKAQGRG
jgi:MoaA/NifB/PqqE/SkfB family radical SAM enzyme